MLAREKKVNSHVTEICMKKTDVWSSRKGKNKEIKGAYNRKRELRNVVWDDMGTCTKDLAIGRVFEGTDLARRLRVSFLHIKGSANELADCLAKKGIEKTRLVISSGSAANTWGFGLWSAVYTSCNVFILTLLYFFLALGSFFGSAYISDTVQCCDIFVIILKQYSQSLIPSKTEEGNR